MQKGANGGRLMTLQSRPHNKQPHNKQHSAPGRRPSDCAWMGHHEILRVET